MKKGRYTEAQMIRFLKQAEAGLPVKELCRKEGFSDATFYKWPAKFGGLKHGFCQRQPGQRAAHQMKWLTVADDFSHESMQIGVDFGIPAAYVTRLLDQTVLFRGYPKAVRTDNPPEFTSRAGQCRTVTSRASMANSVMNVSINTGSPHWSTLEPKLPRPITTNRFTGFSFSADHHIFISVAESTLLDLT